MRNFVPTEVKTQKKFSAKIYMFDFFFILGFVGFGLLTQNMVIPSLRIIFLIFNFLLGLLLSRRSPYNPGKDYTSPSGFTCGVPEPLIDLWKQKK